MKISKGLKRVLTFSAIPLLFIAAIALVIVIYSTSHKAPQVDLMSTSFAPQKIEIPEGERVHFVNQSSVTQTICLGFNKQCDQTPLLPGVLKSPGIQIGAKQAKDVVFDTYGTFHVTSVTVPAMNLTITVDAAG